MADVLEILEKNKAIDIKKLAQEAYDETEEAFNELAAKHPELSDDEINEKYKAEILEPAFQKKYQEAINL